MGRRVLLPEVWTALSEPLRQTLQRHRAIPEMRDEAFRYTFIEAKYVPFRNSEFREEDLAFIREFDRAWDPCYCISRWSVRFTASASSDV